MRKELKEIQEMRVTRVFPVKTAFLAESVSQDLLVSLVDLVNQDNLVILGLQD